MKRFYLALTLFLVSFLSIGEQAMATTATQTSTLTTRTFHPVQGVGMVYMRAVNSNAPLAFVGGVEKLEIAVNDEKKKQQTFDRPGGGTRAQVVRIKDVMFKADLQDFNAVNMARAVFGSAAEVMAATVVDEAHTAYQSGLVALAHLNPTNVVLKADGAPIAAAGNYEVRPEGIFVMDNAADIDDGDAITVSYAHSGYDVVQALVTAAPTVEIRFAGINEAMDGSSSVVDIFRCQLGATKALGFIDDNFAKLQIEGEVLSDPTKTGAGLSRFFKVQMQKV